MKESQIAYEYARDVIKGRWPEAEPFIKQDRKNWVKYKKIGKT